MTLLVYICRAFTLRFLAVLAALCALVELVEMLDAMRKLVGPNSSIWNILTFSVLRLPLAFEQMFPLAVLIASVLSFRLLGRRSEMIALRSAGMSPYQLLRMLLPFMAVLSLAYYALVNHMAPAAERAFADWWNDVDQERIATKNPAQDLVWLRSGNEIVSVVSVRERGRRLHGLSRYSRNRAGQLTGRISASTAKYGAEGWCLHDVTITNLRRERLVTQHLNELMWGDGPRPENFNAVALPTERLNSSASREILKGTVAAYATEAHYRIVVQRGLCAPILPVLMVLLAVPAATGYGRNSRGTFRATVTSLGVGISFPFMHGVLISAGEASVLPAALAVWTAPLTYLAVGIWLFLYFEE